MVKQLAPVILKLGGSVITVKDKPFTPNTAIMKRVAEEISEAGLKSLVVVHGGGSFGHPVAKEYFIADGYKNQEQLMGFSKTRQAMMTLNKLLVDAFIEKGLPAVSMQPSAFIMTEKSRITEIDSTIVERLISIQTIPILFGDAVLDTKIGFTILSGDQIVASLAIALKAERIVMCVDVDGLYSEDPKVNPKAEFIERMTLGELRMLLGKIGKSQAVDVTSGMYGKIVELIPAIESGINVKILNGRKAGCLYKALTNENVKNTAILGG